MSTRETEVIPAEPIEGAPGLDFEEKIEEGVLEEPEVQKIPYFRILGAAFFACLSAAATTGGMFQGFPPRAYAVVAIAGGVALAFLARRFKNQVVMNLTLVIGILVIGLVLVIPSGIDNLFNLGSEIRTAALTGNVLRPPVEFDPGWRALLAWVMAAMGVASAWVGVELRRPGLAIMLPLPLTAIGAINLPDSQKIGSGIAALLLLGIALGILSGIDVEGGATPSLAYEVRRLVKAVPLLAAVTGIMILLARANFLFPPPLYDPAQEARKPKAQPLTEAEDRVLFTVDSTVSGPWRTGHLDIYEQRDSTWRLPPFGEADLAEVPESGIVKKGLRAGVRATFELRGYSGVVLPSLPNVVAVVAEGPILEHDSRTDTIRLAEGRPEPGFKYSVTAAKIPTVEELQKTGATIPKDIEQFLEIPDPPPAVRVLLKEAPTTSTWDKFDFLRQKLLTTVVAEGTGTPVAVHPIKVHDMLAITKEGSPFEIVAGQAMLARWAGVPSRIGYGFDGGEQVGALLEVRPRHGASFLEIYFDEFGWLPVIGSPVQARTSFSDNPLSDNQALPSEDISVRLYVPIALSPEDLLFQRIRILVFIVVPIFAAIVLGYYAWPGLRKALLRSRRRDWARAAGPRARIAVAYSEWRDLSTDFGYRHNSDTPLMFLDRVAEDEEHSKFAWLVTRCLWGDLQDKLAPEDALAAEELSRALKKRMSQAHPFTLRSIAAVSRLSLRDPYFPKVPDLELQRREETLVG